METNSEKPSSTKQGSNCRGTVLVAENEQFVLRLLEQVLSKRGFQVLLAADGQEAIETYCRHKTEIDVVLLDVGLPKVDGLNVFYKMKSENPDVRVIIVSGFLEPELRTKMHQAGVQHFIDKPYMLDQLVETIQSLIETPRSAG
jgi:two-component system, cell cycle sensor histidine kinase and response regulator CckA